jgi:hypothetical protein
LGEILIKNVEEQKIHFDYMLPVFMLPVFIPSFFALVVMVYFRARFEYPQVPPNNCLKAEAGSPVVTREIAGTLQFTSGMFIVKDAQNHITALTRCGKVACLGPYHELKNRMLKEPPIRAIFCGKTLVSVMFDDGYSPNYLERR